MKHLSASLLLRMNLTKVKAIHKDGQAANNFTFCLKQLRHLLLMQTTRKWKLSEKDVLFFCTNIAVSYSWNLLIMSSLVLQWPQNQAHQTQELLTGVRTSEMLLTLLLCPPKSIQERLWPRRRMWP